MSDEIITKENTTTEIAKPTSSPVSTPASSYAGNSNDREFRKNRRPTRRPNAPRNEFEQKMLAIRRVTRVSSGGRRFSFSVVMAIGNGKGKVGVGIGKAGDTALAIVKAIKRAKKNMIDIKTTKDMSIPHMVEAKYSSAIVSLQPSAGKGVVAGSSVRDLIELGGLKDIVGKVRSGSKNKLNIAHATLAAFKKLSNPKY
jgi:small subunit ribosomal protein S5